MIDELTDTARVELTAASGAEHEAGGNRPLMEGQDRRRGSPGSSRRSSRRSRPQGRAVMASAIGRYGPERCRRGVDALHAYLDRGLSLLLIVFYFFKPVLALGLLLTGLLGMLVWRLTRAWRRFRR